MASTPGSNVLTVRLRTTVPAASPSTGNSCLAMNGVPDRLCAADAIGDDLSKNKYVCLQNNYV